ADNYFEKLSVRKDEIKEIKFINSLFDEDFETSLFEEFADNVSIGMAALLGQRTAEMHLALSSSEEDTVFKAEPVTIFYQRSVYQSMRSIIKSTFRLFRSKINYPDNNLQKYINEFLDYEDSLLSFIERILKIKFYAK